MNHKWPTPNYLTNDEPLFIFMVTPPFSGSTAIAAILNSSKNISFLHDSGEGQWLIPGLHDDDRWVPSKEVNYAAIKATWLNRYQELKRESQNIHIIVEKSPPNMVRLPKLLSLFSHKIVFANNRNPIANCASILYRNYDADRLHTKERSNILNILASEWVKRSLIIRSLIIKQKLPFISYEDFCLSPESLKNVLTLPKQEIDLIDFNTKIKIKDYPIQPVTNQNTRQINKLSLAEIKIVVSNVNRNPGLLDFFGYRHI